MAEEKTTTNETEQITPITIEDGRNGNVYLLEFNRETVEFAENRGLKPQTVENDLGMIVIRELFYCAFRMHQPKMSKANTDKILDELEGLTSEQLKRLLQLFELPYKTVINDDERKNSKMTVKL